MRFTAKIEDGKVKWHDERGLKHYLSKLEGEVYVDIKPSDRRNTAQNNYFWIILRKFADWCGEDLENMHDICRRHCHVTSTKELNVDEFSDYLDKILRLAAKMGFPIQDPRKTTRLP